jgi:large subunit ribosomal protein L24
VKHFERRTQQNQAGGIVEREGTMHLSKLALTCPKCRRPVRVGWRASASGDKQRICRGCGGPL